jgi:Pectinacetylesterase
MKTRKFLWTVLSSALTAACIVNVNAQADPIPKWGNEVDLVGLVDSSGQLLARDGSVLADQSGEPLRPACALSAVTPEPFRFFVQAGRSDRLLIYHDGGGACWESNTCVTPLVSNAPIYDPRITENEYNLAYAGGVLDGTNAANPFKDWTKVFIPYCTGDVGWGNRDVIYQTVQGPLPIRHRGYANIRAVLRWLEDYYRDNNLPAPAKVALTGSSAGAYATIGTVFPEAIKLLPRTTDTYVIADSGNGVVTDSFLASAKANWGYESTLPKYLVPVLAGGADGLPVRFFGELTKRFRGTRFGQFQNAYDSIQTLVLNTMKYSDDPTRWTDPRDLVGSLVEWSLKARLATNLSAVAPNYRFYTAAGSEHEILVNIPVEANAGFCSDNFYTENSAAELKFRNWTNAMVNGGGYLWNTGNWRNATCFPNCVVPAAPGCMPLVQP